MSESDTETFKAVRFMVRDCNQYKIGRFQFNLGTYVAESQEDHDELKALVDAMPTALRRRISVIDESLGERLVKAHQARTSAPAHQGGATSDTNAAQTKQEENLPTAEAEAETASPTEVTAAPKVGATVSFAKK